MTEQLLLINILMMGIIAIGALHGRVIKISSKKNKTQFDSQKSGTKYSEALIKEAIMSLIIKAIANVLSTIILNHLV